MAEEIQPEELRKMMHDKDIVIVDIRNPALVKQKTVPGSINIDVYEDIYVSSPELIKRKLAVLPKDKKIITVCNVGRTSVFASQILEDMGYKTASLAGGVEGWD
ncbi:rhodanese-like domain-containing protein [Candidatus Woesearchaeota archaeon]|nr:rhodanese-like domain-containing protein [Candidatus Woesearchaeota archaeon]